MFDTEIGTLTGDTASEVMSSGPDVFLNFKSDGSETKTGFRLQYEPGTLYHRIITSSFLHNLIIIHIR